MVYLGFIADVVTILSFCITITLLIKSDSLIKEIYSQKQEYQKDKNHIKIKMIALRENLWNGQKLNLRLISEIRTLLYSFSQKFSKLKTSDDKIHLKTTFDLLSKDENLIDIKMLCAELDYFIARFERIEIQ